VAGSISVSEVAWPRAFLAAVCRDFGGSAVDVAGDVEAGEHAPSLCSLLGRTSININSGARHVHQLTAANVMLACVAQ
jgi:hypothetical protein